MKRILSVWGIGIAWIIFSLFLAGCIDLDLPFLRVSTFGAISKSKSGKVAVVLDKQGRLNTSGRIVLLENGKRVELPIGEVNDAQLAWTDKDELLFVNYVAEEGKWTVNQFSLDTYNSKVIFDEDKQICFIQYSPVGDFISYLLKNADGTYQLLVYNIETGSNYIVADDVVYDYEWVPGEKKVIFLRVNEKEDEQIEGEIVIRDVEDLTEDVIIEGRFPVDMGYVDICSDGKTGIIGLLDEEGRSKFYLYDFLRGIKKGFLYEIKGAEPGLLYSIGSNLAGNIVFSKEEEEGQYILVDPLTKTHQRMSGIPVAMVNGKVFTIDFDTGKMNI